MKHYGLGSYQEDLNYASSKEIIYVSAQLETSLSITVQILAQYLHNFKAMYIAVSSETNICTCMKQAFAQSPLRICINNTVCLGYMFSACGVNKLFGCAAFASAFLSGL